MRFELLGPVGVVVDGQRHTVARAQARGMFALLLLHAGRGLSREAAIEAVWGGAAPSTARAQVHNAVHDIRARLTHLGGADVIVTEPFGYRADVDPDHVDALVFERRVQLATKAAKRDGDEAVSLLRSALALWAGEPLLNVAGAFAEPARARLVDVRLAAVECLADLELRHGRPEVAATDLAPFVHAYPLRERLRVRLMTALYRSGRQADALRSAREYRALLAEQEGLDPGAEIVEAESRIRRAEEAGTTGTGKDVPPPVPERSRPAQLPAAPAGFAAREDEVARLDELCDGSPHSTHIVALLGPGGAGKTALAVHWAYRRLADFDGGQLYVNLHGFGVDPEVDAFEALGQLLRGLGQADNTLPKSVDERAARYRSLLSGRRMLVVLDNAASSRQVRPLLPGVGPHVTLITSRRSLDGLAIDEGVAQLRVEALPSTDAVRLMRRHVETGHASDDVLAGLARFTDGLPLALRIVAARLRATPIEGLPALVADLTDEQHRLAMLSLPAEDIAVRTAFATSYHALSEPGRWTFRILGLLPSSETSVLACAAAVGRPVGETSTLLAELRAFHLVTATSQGRYQTHDLMRLYARELSDHQEAADQHRDAERRLLEWYVAAANRADELVRPHRVDLGYVPTTPPAGIPVPRDTAGALAWFDLEAENLLRAVERAEHVHPAACWQLAAPMFGWLDRHHRRTSWLPVYETGTRAAEVAGDRAAEALMLGSVAVVSCFLRSFTEAATAFERALVIRRELGQRPQVAGLLSNLGNLYVETGRDADAIRCFTEALTELDSEPGTAVTRGMLFNNLGWAHREAGRFDEAIGCYARAGAIARQLGDPQSISYAEGNLARVHADCGRHDATVGHWQASISYAAEAGDLLLEAGAWKGLGSAQAQLGDYGSARHDLTHALEMYETVDHDDTADVVEMLSSLPSA